MNESTKSLRTIFNEALEIPDAKARADFLAATCGPDAEVRRSIEELIAAHTAAGGFLATRHDRPENAATVLAPPLVEQPGDKIGRYKLREKIGEGGCGVVYVAEQVEPVRRRVALKVIKPGMDSKSVIARFEAERQALAIMDHPNIAKVLDAGTTENGRPYFVMELVRGVRITDYCDQNKLSTRQRLDLFILVCNAVQHAHQKGIIHRDLKPSNILVTVNDGVPVPKVIDFGIAKATEGRLTNLTVYTELHQFIGTPAYMSPEQAEMSSLDIDTRSDIYSLGVLLYELLTGCTPFDPKKLLEAGLDEIRRTIREVEPPRPSTRLSTLANGDLTTVAKSRGSEVIKLVSLIRGDLDWIVMKALEKDRTRRYDTANDFAMDVKRFLGSEPVVARPPNASYRFQKLVRRNKLAVAAVAGTALALVLGMVASSWQAVRARHAEQKARSEAFRAQQAETVATERTVVAEQERQRADQSELETRKSLYAADMDLAFRALDARNYSHVRELLTKYLPGASGARAGQDLRGWEWRYLWGQGLDQSVTLGRHKDASVFVAFSPDGKLVASSHASGGLTVWDAQTHRQTFSTEFPLSTLHCFAWSPDSRSIVIGDFDGKVTHWNSATLQIQEVLSLHEKIWHVAFSRDGKVLALAGHKGLRLLDWETRRELKQIPYEAPDGPRRVAFAPDDRSLAISYDGPVLQLWDWRSGRELLSFEAQKTSKPYEGLVANITFSPDGRLLAAAGRSIACTLWDVATGRPFANLTNHNGWVGGVDFSPDGRSVATTAEDQSIRFWEVTSGRELAVIRDFSGRLHGGRFSPDGNSFVTGSDDGSVKLWRLPLKSDEPESHRLTADNMDEANIWPEERLLSFFTTRASSTLWHVWDLRTMREIYAEPPGTNVLVWEPWRAFVPSQRKSLEYTRDRKLQFRHIPSGATELFLAWDSGEEGSDNVQLAMSTNGRFAAAAGQGEVHVWEVASKRELRRLQMPARFYARGILVSPEGKSLVARGQKLTVWDLESGASRVLPGGFNNSFKFLPGGRLAAADEEGSVKLHDLATGEARISFNGGYRRYCDSALSTDGRRLGLAAWAGVIQFWDLDSERQIAWMRASDHKRFGSSVGFLDENTLASVFGDELKVWRAPSWSEIEASGTK